MAADRSERGVGATERQQRSLPCAPPAEPAATRSADRVERARADSDVPVRDNVGSLARRGVRRLLRSGRLRRFAEVRFASGGKVVRVPLVADLPAGVQFSLTESWLFELLERLLPIRPGAFLDVGVNLGQTLVKCLLLDPGRRYIGFEPNPECVRVAEGIIRANHATHATVVPCGLYERFSMLTLHGQHSVDSAASLVEGFRSAARYSVARHVCVGPGDELVPQLAAGPVALIKIDVEGAEPEVVAGLRETIRAHRPFVLCEILPIYDEATERGRLRRERTDRVVGSFHALDYQLYRIHHVGRIQPLERVDTHGALDLCDYLFVPREWDAATRRAIPVGPA
jgi:FkbM family methyltransferase